MNITVAVGLIASGSTIAGGVIASVTALKVQGKQLKEQSSLARAERAERQATQRRELRRDAYAQLIGRFEELDTLVDHCWQWCQNSKSGSGQPITTFTEKIRAAGNALRALDSPLNIVALEGPTDVEIAARQIALVFGQEFIRVELELIRALAPEEFTAESETGHYEESHMRRVDVKAAFVKAARTALESSED